VSGRCTEPSQLKVELRVTPSHRQAGLRDRGEDAMAARLLEGGQVVALVRLPMIVMISFRLIRRLRTRKNRLA